MKERTEKAFTPPLLLHNYFPTYGTGKREKTLFTKVFSHK